jgi:hypothetical protein
MENMMIPFDIEQLPKRQKENEWYEGKKRPSLTLASSFTHQPSGRWWNLNSQVHYSCPFNPSSNYALTSKSFRGWEVPFPPIRVAQLSHLIEV